MLFSSLKRAIKAIIPPRLGTLFIALSMLLPLVGSHMYYYKIVATFSKERDWQYCAQDHRTSFEMLQADLESTIETLSGIILFLHFLHITNVHLIEYSMTLIRCMCSTTIACFSCSN